MSDLPASELLYKHIYSLLVKLYSHYNNIFTPVITSKLTGWV